MLHDNLEIKNGHLFFAGLDTVELAEKYGTPLMLVDEDKVRQNIAIYKNAIKKYFPCGSFPVYASKALSFVGMYKIMADEGIGADIVSIGELYTAVKAGFPLERAFFHGNNKMDSDINFAMEKGVGFFIVDTFDELNAIDVVAGQRGIKQKILLRLTPGIDTHTHQAVKTGKVDSKFGTAIETGQAYEITQSALSKKNVELVGFHCHIGSQIFEIKPFCDASEIMLNFIKKVKSELKFEAKILNLGGGFGVRYVENHPLIDIADNIKQISEHINAFCKTNDIVAPSILLEPGRSIIANAGLTIYTAGSLKEIKGYKNYVSIDGGMTDNPRYALYQSEYTIICANRADETANYVVTIAGRCCESGDLIQENVLLPKPKRGDKIAVLVTGAYNYSMASNYNRVPRPVIVMIKNKESRIGVRRESLEDIVRLDEE